jgi:hypothetical protein
VYYSRVLGITLKWLNRRSKEKLLVENLRGVSETVSVADSEIHHDFYGLKCLFVNVTEEPYVGNLQVRAVRALKYLTRLKTFIK